jgi:hypothetical protein
VRLTPQAPRSLHLVDADHLVVDGGLHDRLLTVGHADAADLAAAVRVLKLQLVLGEVGCGLRLVREVTLTGRGFSSVLRAASNGSAASTETGRRV